MRVDFSKMLKPVTGLEVIDLEQTLSPQYDSKGVILMPEAFILDADLTAGTIPEGIHLAKCTEAVIEPNKAKDGNNLIFTFFMLTPGQEARSLKLWQSLKPTVAWRYTKILASFGVFPDAATSQFKFDGEQSLLKALIGKKVRLQVSHQDYNGDTRAQIDNVLPETETDSVALGVSASAASEIASSVGLPKKPATPAPAKLPSKAAKAKPAEEPTEPVETDGPIHTDENGDPVDPQASGENGLPF